MNKYELLLDGLSKYIERTDNEILIGFDLTKLKGIIEKAEHEA